MSETIEINGREYTDDEIRAIYAYQQDKFYREDMQRGIDAVLDDGEWEGQEWLNTPASMDSVLSEAECRLDRWLDFQSEVLGLHDASISLLTEDLVREMYKNAHNTQDPD